jgi:hypothetical protein
MQHVSIVLIDIVAFVQLREPRCTFYEVPILPRGDRSMERDPEY